MNTIKTNNGRKVVKISLIFFIFINVVWLGLPFTMAILWSLVDPQHPWSYPDLFPQKLSLARWKIVWEQTSLATALFNSYTIAPAVAILSLLLATPTAYAFGRMTFKGKAVAEMLTLIPLVMPGMIIGIFFSSMLISLNISNTFMSIVIGHTVLTLPYSIRIMSAGFKSIPQDIIDASRDMGASFWGTFCNAFLPMLKPSLLASLIFCLVRSLEEFSISFVLGSPDFITVPTILYSFLGYSFVRPDAAVVSMILVIPNVILMIIIERLLKGNYLSQSTGKA
ncbi:TPA: ABC transporter permease [Providencia stuartii]|uniref:ABC transporter permease n=2 Tax=Providencia stuartii TaxID=588 RepID=A0AAJ1JFR1_PROST|nr:MULTISPECIES: ABC transporter permease [Providencia]SST01154.1 molybdate ABC transporter permease protein [Acinetobacter baumannii]AFH91944.1 binding-protein-dependent transport system inner membrane protein [Providencia stuartii MRSN 2154]AIN64941.1 binding--dependent transport system inner membrane component family protein [Providencia stuartii]AVE43467.1 ABC transporter permease [Providencia stuartii]EMA3643079.1 ABC transporter permease [Providencia stuartii]